MDLCTWKIRDLCKQGDTTPKLYRTRTKYGYEQKSLSRMEVNEHSDFSKTFQGNIQHHSTSRQRRVNEAPSLIKHKLLHPEDRNKWDAAYDEE